MHRPQTSAATAHRYDEIAAGLSAKSGVKASSMFGMPTLKLNGKALAGIHGDAMVFKLSGDAHAEALRIEGAQPFDPSGRGRPMKAWVVVPATQATRWARLAELALASIDG